MCHENLKLTLLLNFLVTVQETMLLLDPLSRTDLKFLRFSELYGFKSESVTHYSLKHLTTDMQCSVEGGKALLF